jgi:nucleotide-binding universal stress UspA family protein
MVAAQQQRPILVPVDFSPDSEAALVHAAELAGVYHAPLLILHVVHDPGHAPGYYAVADRERHLHNLEDVAAGMFADFLRRVASEHPGLGAVSAAQTELVTGLPVQRILEVADRHAVRAIVMGSRGRTGLAHVMLGSKAEQVVRLARAPVTIVKSAAE